MEHTDIPDKNDCHPHHHGNTKLIDIRLNGNTVEIESGEYVVLQLKEALNVPTEYELEVVKGGVFTLLENNECIRIHQHQEFISHVKSGASS